MIEEERKEYLKYMEKYDAYDLADIFNTQTFVVRDDKQFNEILLYHYFKQNEEIEQLEQETKHLKDLQKNMDQQYEKLESNWNALKEILDNTLYKLNGILDRDLLEEQMLLDYSYIRNKIQELEGKNE